ncbi:unnamed protein product [Rotaria sordida]|uniref:PKD/REJ-like domain-containing protein n=1 Tax=Rotaria sordida TaxID=392033 RepID=A0A819JPD3_9BILA|nr:unnamed protein product [Rotaria sordida]
MLSYDVYELKLTVIIIASSNFTSSSSVRVTIALLQIVIDNKLIIQHRVFQMHQEIKQHGTSSVSFKINQCLSNGSCSINPYNGTTITLLSISRLNWFDKDGIKDYSFWANDFSKQSIIEFTSVFDFQVQLLYENVVVRNDLTEIKN